MVRPLVRFALEHGQVTVEGEDVVALGVDVLAVEPGSRTAVRDDCDRHTAGRCQLAHDGVGSVRQASMVPRCWTTGSTVDG
jgi:hypothetical protein